MKILFLSTRLPHAGVAGGHVLVRQRILRLARRGHDVGLAAFGDAKDLAKAGDLPTLLREFEVVAWPRRTALGDAWHLLARGTPPHFRRVRSDEMMRRIGDMVERTGYHVAIAESAAMGQYLHRNRYLPAVRRIVSCHSGSMAPRARRTDILRYRILGLRHRLGLGGLMRCEVNMYRQMDRILVLTAQERHLLLHDAPDLRVSVVPGGVDTDHFRQRAEKNGPPTVFFSGHFSQEANRDAVLWFLRRVWPRVKARVPGVRCRIAGPASAAVLHDRSRRDPALDVVGEVPDLRPHLEDATVFVCPVRLGSGLRLKVLEAMAAGVPVVTTSLGAEGIPLQQGDNGFVADRPELMAEYIDLLLGDPPLRLAIARQARLLMETRFSWELGIDEIERILCDVCAGRAAPSGV